MTFYCIIIPKTIRFHRFYNLSRSGGPEWYNRIRRCDHFHYKKIISCVVSKKKNDVIFFFFIFHIFQKRDAPKLDLSARGK